MSPDDLKSLTEERLRREAAQLLETFGDLPTPSAIVETYRRRRKRRVRLAVAGVVASMVVLAVILSEAMDGSLETLPPRVGTPNIAVDDRSTEAPSVAENEDRIDGQENLVPVLVVRWDKNGEPLVTPGFCVAGPEVTLDVEELTPGERYAVSQVLGTGEFENRSLAF